MLSVAGAGLGAGFGLFTASFDPQYTMLSDPKKVNLLFNDNSYRIRN